MAAPTVQSLTTKSFNSASTTHNVTMPATVNAGDLLILGISFFGSGAITTPSGWSVVCADTAITGTHHCAVYGLSAAGTEGGTNVNVATASSALGASHVYRITGWNGSSVANDVVSGTTATGSGTTPNPPSASWSWGTVDVEALAFSHSVNGSGPTGFPTNYTNGTATNGTDGATGSVQTGSARRAMTAATSPENPSTFTIGLASWAANTVVVRGTIDTTAARAMDAYTQAYAALLGY